MTQESDGDHFEESVKYSSSVGANLPLYILRPTRSWVPLKLKEVWGVSRIVVLSHLERHQSPV